MKKLFILFLFVSNYALGQSVTITPNTGTGKEALQIQKAGIGLDHRSADGNVGVGTYVNNTRAYIQTHTNHSLNFTIDNGSPKMTLETTGNLGIGTASPTERLHVAGNGYFTGNLTSDGNVNADGITIGGGLTITKIFKVSFNNQTLFGLGANVCANKTIQITGVNSGNTIILNMINEITPFIVTSVWASGDNEVKIKFCNISNTPISGIGNVAMQFTIIK